MPDATALRTAARRLAGVALHTPLVEAPILERAAGGGGPVRLKCEQCQPIGAFKIRGAYLAIAALAPAARRRGVVTHSSGNHGQAVAFAARAFGVRAVVVMPRQAPATKVAGVRRHGAEVVFVDDPANEREPTAQGFVTREGLTLIPPFDHPDIVLGQATVGLEILEDAPDTAAILAPVGGGGLLGGIATAVRALDRPVEVIGVEPAGAATLAAALEAGTPVRLPRCASVADGLLSPQIGQLPWQAMQGVVRRSIAVSDDEIRGAVRFAFRTLGLRLEPSGATALAALRSGRVAVSGPTAVVLTGGNVDADPFTALVA